MPSSRWLNLSAFLVDGQNGNFHLGQKLPDGSQAKSFTAFLENVFLLETNEPLTDRIAFQSDGETFNLEQRAKGFPEMLSGIARTLVRIKS